MTGSINNNQVNTKTAVTNLAKGVAELSSYEQALRMLGGKYQTHAQEVAGYVGATIHSWEVYISELAKSGGSFKQAREKSQEILSLLVEEIREKYKDNSALGSDKDLINKTNLQLINLSAGLIPEIVSTPLVMGINFSTIEISRRIHNSYHHNKAEQQLNFEQYIEYEDKNPSLRFIRNTLVLSILSSLGGGMKLTAAMSSLGILGERLMMIGKEQELPGGAKSVYGFNNLIREVFSGQIPDELLNSMVSSRSFCLFASVTLGRRISGAYDSFLDSPNDLLQSSTRYDEISDPKSANYTSLARFLGYFCLVSAAAIDMFDLGTGSPRNPYSSSQLKEILGYAGKNQEVSKAKIPPRAYQPAVLPPHVKEERLEVIFHDPKIVRYATQFELQAELRRKTNTLNNPLVDALYVKNNDGTYNILILKDYKETPKAWELFNHEIRHHWGELSDRQSTKREDETQTSFQQRKANSLRNVEIRAQYQEVFARIKAKGAVNLLDLKDKKDLYEQVRQEVGTNYSDNLLLFLNENNLAAKKNIQTYPGLSIRDINQSIFELCILSRSSIVKIYSILIQKGESEYLSKLEAMLRETDRRVRQASARAVCEVYKAKIAQGESEYLSKLEAMLRDTDWQVREAATTAVCEVYKAKILQGESVDLSKLEAMLRDSNWQVREASAMAASEVYKAKIAQGESVDLSKLEAMLRDSDSDVRKASAMAVSEVYKAKIAQGESVDLSKLEAMLRDSDWQVREASAMAVSEVYKAKIAQGESVDLSKLEAMFSDTDRRVRQASARAVCEVYKAKIAQGESVDLSKLEARLKSTDWWEVRQASTRAVCEVYKAKIAQGESEYLSKLEAMLRDSDSDVRKASAMAVSEVYKAKIAQGESVDLSKLEAMLRDSNWQVRGASARAVCEVYKAKIAQGESVDLSKLEAMLNDDDSYVREAATRAVCEVYKAKISEGESVDLSKLEAMLRDSDVYVRKASATAVSEVYKAKISEGESVDLSKLEAMLNDDDSYVREAATRAVCEVYKAKISEGESVDLSKLEAMLRDSDVYVRKASATAVSEVYKAKISEGESVDLSKLEAMLRDSNWQVRGASARAVCEVYKAKILQGERVDLSKLEALLTDTDSDVREAAQIEILDIICFVIINTDLKADGNKQLIQKIFSNYGLWQNIIPVTLPVFRRAVSQFLGLSEESKTELGKAIQNLKSAFVESNNLIQEERRISEDEIRKYVGLGYFLECLYPGSMAHCKSLLKSGKNGPLHVIRFLDSKTALFAKGRKESDFECLEVLVKRAENHSRKKFNIDNAEYYKLLDIMSVYIEEGYLDKFKESVNQYTSNPRDFPGLNRLLRENYIKIFTSSLGIQNVNNEKFDLANIDTHFAPRLKTAYNFLLQQHPGKVKYFGGLIKAALEDNYWDFLEDVGQEDEVGREVAKHNSNIRELSWNLGIDLDRFLGKKDQRLEEKSFIYKEGVEKLVDLIDPINSVKDYTDRVLREIPERCTIDLSKLFNDLKSGDGGKKLNEAILEIDNISRLLDEINILLAKSEVKGAPQMLELATHYKEKVELLLELLKPKDKSGSRSRLFSVRQIIRKPGYDIFLADHTQCCLGMSSNQYPDAMVERLIDESLGMIEVIDEVREKPMANLWLYLASDGSLVVQNIEINSSYETDSTLKEAIGKQMIEYAISLAKHIGAKKVYAGNASHGKYSNNLSRWFKLTDFGLDKPGGYLDNVRYYLDTAGQAKAYSVIDNSANTKVEDS